MKLMDMVRRMFPLLINQMKTIQKKHLNRQMHSESRCLRRALEIWAEVVAEAVDVEAEAEGVAITTTINSTITKTATTKVITGVVPIQLEPRLPARQSRLNSSRHHHLQGLTNCIQGRVCLMALVGSQWAEGSHKYQHPLCPLVNLDLQSRNRGDGDTAFAVCHVDREVVRDCLLEVFVFAVCFLIYGPYMILRVLCT